MNEELKACPFCGGKAEVIEAQGLMGAFIVCQTCRAGTDDFSGPRGKEKAIAAWNRRYSDDYKAKTLDRLALTRARFPHMYEDTPAPREARREGYSTCPNCGQETLIHEDGCAHCRSCGWSACG